MTPRQARLGIDLFTGAVVASVALALANLTWRLAGEPGIGPVAAPVMARGGDSVDITQLVALSPFGSAASAAQSSDSSGAVTLKAVFLAFPAEASIVLLASADGKVASYGIGSAVAGGVIEAIAAEQISVRTNGGLQTIGFTPANGGAPVSGQPPGAPIPPGGRAQPVPPPAPPAVGVDAIRALIPSSVQGRPGVAPATVISTTPPPSGYRLGNELPAALAKAGLRAGDMVQRVNGNPIGPGSNVNDIAAGAIASGSAQVEVVRNGQRMSLTISAR
ncbi:MAG: type II secretion system protein N [Croceibacterium sp.]